MDTFLGPVVRVNFFDPDSGYAIFRIKAAKSETEGYLSVKGVFYDVESSVGKFVKVVGKPGNDGAVNASAIYPPSLERARDHVQDLFSGYPYKALNKGLRYAIEQAVGSEWRDLLLKSPSVLDQVQIDEEQRTKAKAAWRSAVTRLRPYSILRNLGLSHRQAMSSIDSLGTHAELVFFREPYILSMIQGVGFRKADEFAISLGVASGSKERLRRYVANELEVSEAKGHTIARLATIHQKLKGTFNISYVELKKFLKEDPALDFRLYRLHKTGDFIARPSAIYTAKSIADRLVTLSKNKNTKEIAIPKPISEFELDSGQKIAIETAVANPVSIITGGPGTGKTTIIKEVAAALRANNPGERIRYSALAGKAARRMEASTGEKASTLNALLGMKPGEPPKYHAGNRLEVDTLVLDESSMVDEALFADVLKAIPDSCRLIIVGDVGQLPSIGPGAVMRDLMDSGQIPYSRLAKSNRFAEDSEIANAAMRIMAKEMPKLQSEGKLRWADHSNSRDIAEAIAEEAKRAVRNGVSVDDIQCLSPQLGTEAGAEALSARLKPILNPGAYRKPSIAKFGREFHLDDRVMQTGKNDYELNLFNGDIGKIIEIDYQGRSHDGIPSIVLQIDDERAKISVPFDKIGSLRLAYCMTVHKSQGSEYQHLLMPVSPDHKNMIDQQLLNTAITRCRNEGFIAGCRETLRKAVRNSKSSKRETVLSEAVDKAFSTNQDVPRKREVDLPGKMSNGPRH